MATIQYTPRARNDILRLVLFAAEMDMSYAEKTTLIIEDGVMLLGRHPQIGREVLDTHYRELVISHGNSGYIALYHYDELLNIVSIVAVRHQRELEYPTS